MSRLDMTDYIHAIITDVRDVVFQRNPSEWLRKGFSDYMEFELVAPSEGIEFHKEEWNANNMKQGFGPNMWDLQMKNSHMVYNVGTIAGDVLFMRDLCHTIFSMTEGRYYPSDQSAFNVLVHGLLSHRTMRAWMQDGWAAQCGTTLDPTKPWLWERLNEPRPVVKDGEVFTVNGEKFYIVHQWDRVPELKTAITEKYVY
jgi:hypothetical protein